MGKIFSSEMLNNRQATNDISRAPSLCLLVLGAAVVVGDPGPGSVPVGTLGWDASGLWHFGRHALHPVKKYQSNHFSSDPMKTCIKPQEFEVSSINRAKIQTKKTTLLIKTVFY